LAGVVDEEGTGSLAPRLGHGVAQGLRQVGGPAAVSLGVDAYVRVGELSGRQPLLVLATRGDHRVDQGVTRLGVVLEVEARYGAGSTQVVPGIPEQSEQAN